MLIHFFNSILVKNNIVFNSLSVKSISFFREQFNTRNDNNRSSLFLVIENLEERQNVLGENKKSKLTPLPRAIVPLNTGNDNDRPS